MVEHYFTWTLEPGADHCQSCLDLDGHTHLQSEWEAAGLYPGCAQLVCTVHCKCHLVDAGAAAQPAGNMTAVYLIVGAAAGLGKWVIDQITHTLRFVPAHPDDTQHNPTRRPKPGAGGGGTKAMESDEAISELGDGEERTLLSAGFDVSSAGQFEVMAITAGLGNGWDFTRAALMESVPLWDGVHCFVDHIDLDAAGHSVRDLAGMCTAPEFVGRVDAVDPNCGIKLTLLATGPSGPLLTALGRSVLAAKSAGGLAPNVGFSADVIFTHKDQVVDKILRVLSLDLVYHPARGGEFIRALNARMKDEGGRMKEEKTLLSSDLAQGSTIQNQEKEFATMPEVEKTTSTVNTVETELTSMRALLAENARLEALAAEESKAKEIRVQMCGYLLDSGLAASKLPAPAADRVRKQFAGKVFTAQELTGAIDDARDLISALTAADVVQGPRINGMVVTEERLQAAVDDLLGAPRDAGKEKVDAARLTGIRELYMMLTGDFDLHGGYYPSRTRLATTTDFTGLVKNAMNKMVVNQWEQLSTAGYGWWKAISTVEHFNSLNGITGTLVGTVGTLPSVAEGAEYTELAVGDSPETATFTKYGGYIPLTLELIDRDMTRKLAAYPRELANASIRKISALVAALFSASAGAGPTMADTGALFNATALATKGGHLNLLTTALSAAQWETVSAAIYNQKMLVKQDTGYYGTGPKMALAPRYLLVPRALQLTAKQILYPDFAYVATYFSNNQQQQQMGDVLTVPDWTDADDWAAACDPALAPAIFVGERFGLLPEIYISGDELSPAVFSNDEHRLKIRHFLAVWVNDFRPLANNHVN